MSVLIDDFSYSYSVKHSNINILQFCAQNNVDVPRFCFHERLSVAGNCRMCLVEEYASVKLLASCAVRIDEKAIIYTQSVRVKKAREAVIEFLLVNHPLDCPICDQGGECDLQDQTIVYGGDRGRFYESKRAIEDKNCGPLIKTIMNRCIHCTRCVRFLTELAGDYSLGILGRGSRMEIGLYIDNVITSELSGNIIDLCPVGALTAKPYAFVFRSWEVLTYPSIDVFDSLLSAIRVDMRGNKIIRILPRYGSYLTNDYWISDKIRFFFDSVKVNRLLYPMVKFKCFFIRLSWQRSFYYIKAYFSRVCVSLVDLKKQFMGLKLFFSSFTDFETLFISSRIIYNLGLYSSFSFVRLAPFRHYFYNIKTFDFNWFLFVGCNLRIDAPLLNLLFRRKFLMSSSTYYTVGPFCKYNYYFKSIGSSYRALLNIFEGRHWFSVKFLQAKIAFIVSDNFTNFNKLPTNLVFSLSNFSKYSSYLMQMDLGVNASTNNQNYFCLPNLCSYFLGFDSIFKKLNNSFIYQGHHNDNIATQFKIILPAYTFLETTSVFYDLYGNFSYTTALPKDIVFKNVRSSWRILSGLFSVLGFKGYKTRLLLLKDLFQYVPIKKGVFSIGSNLGYFSYINIPQRIVSFYFTDIFCKNSRVMGILSKEYEVHKHSF